MDWAKSEGLPFVNGPRYSNGHTKDSSIAADHIRGRIEELLASAPAELAATVRAWVGTVGDDTEKLRAGLNRLVMRIGEENGQ